jgi:hypothetical protein
MEARVKAECQCGQLTLELPQRPLITIACHCLACQRRTGAPFGVQNYYRGDQVRIDGEAKAYKRVSDEGNDVETFFCPNCGSTVFLRLAKQPDLVGVAIGAIADPASAPPKWSVWEQSRHPWIDIAGDVRHFPQGDHAA